MGIDKLAGGFIQRLSQGYVLKWNVLLMGSFVRYVQVPKHIWPLKHYSDEQKGQRKWVMETNRVTFRAR